MALVDKVEENLKENSNDKIIFTHLKNIMIKCWSYDAIERPSASEVIEMLNPLLPPTYSTVELEAFKTVTSSYESKTSNSELFTLAQIQSEPFPTTTNPDSDNLSTNLLVNHEVIPYI